MITVGWKEVTNNSFCSHLNLCVPRTKALILLLKEKDKYCVLRPFSVPQLEEKKWWFTLNRFVASDV